MADSNVRLKAIVQGRVQGVGYRYFTLERAEHLHLVGTVRNLRNGDVEVIAEGSRGALEALLAGLHHGPSMARIDQIHTSWLPATDEFTSFRSASTL